jgi:hypothetical protein
LKIGEPILVRVIHRYLRRLGALVLIGAGFEGILQREFAG